MPAKTNAQRFADLEERVSVLEEKLAASEARGKELVDKLRLARAKQLAAAPEVQEQLAAAFAQRMNS